MTVSEILVTISIVTIVLPVALDYLDSIIRAKVGDKL